MRKIILSLLCAAFPHVGAMAAELHVGSGHPHASVAAALEKAATGDVIKVHSGVYQEGNLRIGKSVTLEGIGFPVLDGGGKFDMLTITAPGVRVTGFELRHTGRSGMTDFAGIKITETSRATIEGNRFRDCQFAVHITRSTDCIIRSNDVRGSIAHEINTGNGIHLWHCSRAIVRGNEVRGQRDGIYLEFSTESLLEDNMVENNLRYGLHFMFSHGNAYHRNSFQRNGAGVAVMYSRDVEMSRNYFGLNWGSASYGLLLKEMTNGRITGNTFERNTTALTFDGSNRMTVEGNEFRENGRAIQLHSSSSTNLFSKNNFSGNAFDIAAAGELNDNRLERNYWDKYEGYDLRRDGTGDVPYRPVSLYAVMVDRVPPAVLLLRSPIVHVLDRAEKTFPSITPETVKDDFPVMRPHPLQTYRPAAGKKSS